MASGPITSWQIDGETVETVTDYFWGAPKSLQMVTAAMKLKESYDQLRQHIIKLYICQHITLPTKVCLVKDLFFLIVMYGCESWTIKKAEH